MNGIRWGAKFVVSDAVIRIFGSHTEAKRELRHWLDAYPDARIVDEVDL